MEAPLLLPVSTAPAASSCFENIITADAAPSGRPVPSSSSSSPSRQSTVLRVVTVIAVACASLFAQHEAGKGFAVAVVNDAPRGSAAARRFDLLFVSNGRAERALLHASRGVERALFPDPSFPRRHVRRVTVRMAGSNLTAGGGGATLHAAAAGDYVVTLSPSLVASTSAGSAADAVAAALRRAVARMWLWDGRGAAPARVTESMVEYLATVAAGEAAATPLSAEDGHDGCRMSSRLLRHLEARREGFVARLNRAMRDRWSDAAVDAALGAPARLACAAAATTTTPPLTGQDDPTTAALAGPTSDATARGSSVAM